MGNGDLPLLEKRERLLLQTIMDNAPAGIALVDGKSLKVTWCNKAFRDQLDEPYAGIDVRDLPLKEFIPQFKGSRLETLLKEAARSKKTHTESHLELRGTSRGTTFWRVSLVPYVLNGDEPEILLLSIETTEQTKALKGIEQLLKREEEERLRLRAILDTLPVGVIVSDSKGGFIEKNETFDRIWGGKAPLCTKVRDYAMYSGRRPDSGEALKPEDWALARALSKGEPVMGDAIDIQRFDGRDATVLNSAAPIRNAEGDIIGAVQVTQDITERRRIETELDTARAILEAVIDQMPAGVAVARAPSGKVIFGNAELERMFGETMTRAPGTADMGQWQTMHPDGVPMKPEEQAIARSIKKGETVKGMEVLLKRGDGTVSALNVNSAPIRDKRGRITGGVTVNVDITDKKRAEQELKERARELERSNAELEQFAYAASHDLREPLRAISGYMSLLRQSHSDKLDEEGRKYVEASIQGADRLNRLIEDMLAYSKIGSKGCPFLVTDFERAFMTTLDGLKETVKDSGAIVTHDPLPSAVADEGQMIEVFQNLLTNAIKYRSAAQPRIHTSAERKGSEWVFSVSDNGEGVPQEHRDKIWRMFYRVHNKQNRPGTGMGLSICRKIVERHGGRIWVEDNPTGGSVFKFTIPAKWSLPKQAPEKPDASMAAALKEGR